MTISDANRGMTTPSYRGPSTNGLRAMFAYLRFRWDSWRLRRQQRRAEKQNKLKIAASKARGASADHVDEMELKDATDYFHFQDEIRQLTSAMPLVLRRAQGRRPGDWGPDDYDVFDGERDVGRIFRINAATEVWWWGVGFQLIGRKSHGTAETLDEAKAAFKAEYERWQPRA